MTRKNKIALYGGLLGVSFSYLLISYFGRRIRYNKISKMIDTIPGGNYITDIQDSPELAQAFNIQYHQGATIPVGNYYKSPNNKVMKWRDDIYEAGHGGTGWGTDDTKIEGAFRSMPDKVSVSQVADSYYSRYGIDLYADILSELEDSPKVSARIVDRVGQLPNYTTY